MKKAILACFIAGIPMTVAANVYRCEQQGRPLYTDRPCHAGAQPERLTPATVLESTGRSVDLVRQYDDRLSSQTSARDRANRQWLKDHAVRKAREERIRWGLINDEVVEGMSPAQVRMVWGEPSRSARTDKGGVAKERWTYSGSGQTRYVNFKDGEVISATRRKDRVSRR